MRPAFKILAAMFGAAALYHLVAVLDPALDPTSPAWRHALFVALNLACAAGFAVRPPAFVFLFGLLLAQQILSHGAAMWRTWMLEGKLDVPSLGVLVVMPIAFALLVVERRAMRARAAARG